MRALSVLALICVSLPGCKGKPNEAHETPVAHAEAKPTDSTHGVPAVFGAGQRARMLPRLTLGVLTVDEVRPLVPKVEQAHALGEPTALSGGRQIRVVLCSAKGALDAIADRTRAGLDRAGWKTSQLMRHGEPATRIGLSGVKGDLRVGAAIPPTATPACDATRGEVAIELTLTRLVKLPPLDPGGSGGESSEAVAPGAAL